MRGRDRRGRKKGENVRLHILRFSKDCIFRVQTIPSQMEIKMAIIDFGWLILTTVSSWLSILHGS